MERLEGVGEIMINIFVCGLMVFSAQAATSYKRALDKKLNAYLEEGVFVGGRAGKGFTLLNVRRDVSKKMKMERVILDVGDLNGKPVKGKVGFYQASVDKDPARVVIDLAQFPRSAVTDGKLKKVFAGSEFIKKAEITTDPEDNTSSLILALRKPMKIEVFEMPAKNKPGRIVVDLKAIK